MGKPPVGFAPLKECLHMIGKEQIDAYFADKEGLLVEAVSRLVSIDLSLIHI